jgi:hypothetical protein
MGTAEYTPKNAYFDRQGYDKPLWRYRIHPYSKCIGNIVFDVFCLETTWLFNPARTWKLYKVM